MRGWGRRGAVVAAAVLLLSGTPSPAEAAAGRFSSLYLVGYVGDISVCAFYINAEEIRVLAASGRGADDVTSRAGDTRLALFEDGYGRRGIKLNVVLPSAAGGRVDMILYAGPWADWNFVTLPRGAAVFERRPFNTSASDSRVWVRTSRYGGIPAFQWDTGGGACALYPSTPVS